MKAFASALVALSILAGFSAAAQEPPAPLAGYGSGTSKAAIPPPPAPQKGTTPPVAAPTAPAKEPARSSQDTAAVTADGTPMGKTMLRILAPMRVDRPGSGAVEAQATFVDAGGVAREAVVKGRVTPSAERPDGVAIKVDWTGATVAGSGEVRFPQPLVSNLLAAPGDVGGTVSTGTQLPAYGDVDGALASINRAAKVVPKNDKPAEKEAPATGNANPALSASSAPTPTKQSAYQPLTPNTVANDDKVPQISVSTAVCEGTEVSFAEGLIYTKEQTITTTDGAVSAGPCERALPGNRIQWAYEGCSNAIDAGGTFAQKQRKPYWIDKAGITQSLGPCELDPNTKFPIKTTEDGCLVDRDLNAMTAYKMVRTYYSDSVDGVDLDVKNCGRADPAVSWPIKETRCTDLRPDFNAGVAYLQTRFSYLRDGVEVQVSPCTDTVAATKYTITDEACADSVDLVANKAVAMSRKRADTDQGPVYLSICTPSGNQTDVLSSIEGCESFHNDYMAAGFSRGGRRWYYKLGALKTWLSQTCEESDVVYNHDYIREGWVNDDVARTGTEKLAVYIDLPSPAGRTLVAAASVRTNSVAIPYTPAGNSTVPDGNSTYQGCNAYRTTTLADLYTRPDGTTYTLAKGAGTPTGPVNVCVATTVGSQAVKMQTNVMVYVGTWSGTDGDAPTPFYTYNDMFKTVSKVDNKNQETGLVVSSTCSVVPGTTTYSALTGPCNGNNCNRGNPIVYWPEPLTACPY